MPPSLLLHLYAINNGQTHWSIKIIPKFYECVKITDRPLSAGAGQKIY